MGDLLMLGIGLRTTQRLASASKASGLLSGETQGLALDFSDSYFVSATGLYGSALIIDTGTPANNYSGSPYGKLVYSPTLPKITRQADGSWKYQPHNLFLNSAAVATQTITVVANLQYKVIITGAGSIVLSGATSATVTDGAPATFTAGSTSLVCTVVGSPTTARVLRTPVADTYVETAGAAKYTLPFEWDSSGALDGVRQEEGRINLFLNSRVPVTQNITTSATTYTVSFVGTGSITLSGTATGTLNGTGANDRVSLAVVATAGTLTCTVAGSIDFVQVEAGAVATSPIITDGTTVTRPADSLTLPTSTFPFLHSSGSLVTHFTPTDLNATLHVIHALSDGTTANRVMHSFTTTDDIGHRLAVGGAGTVTTTSTNVLTANAACKLGEAVTSNDYQAYVNGAATTSDATVTMPTTGITTLGIGIGPTSGGNGLNGIVRSIVYVPRRLSNAELQSKTGA
jgi:hypothetical protein